ncbi:hypothetical protein CSM15_005141, partial [Salmonella enterica subsp. diarizonae]|nr:hypothetical protein [Salmonella enterica subsp. diarizonae]
QYERDAGTGDGGLTTAEHQRLKVILPALYGHGPKRGSGFQIVPG